MTGRFFGSCVMLLAASACGQMVPTSPRSVVGQYAMTGFKGSRNLPCCQTDSSGVVVTISGGGMQLGLNTPAGVYEWDVVRTYEYANGTSQQVQSPFSVGTYTWDGQTLTLIDSTGLASMTGVLAGGVLTVGHQGQEYEFLKLVQLPQ